MLVSGIITGSVAVTTISVAGAISGLDVAVKADETLGVEVAVCVIGVVVVAVSVLIPGIEEVATGFD